MNIKEVSHHCDVTADTIRYYEKIGIIPNVKRNQQGIRVFDEEDIRWIIFAKQMRHAGLPIKELVTYLTLFQAGDETIPERKKILREQIIQTEHKISEMQKALNRLKYKLENYDNHMYQAENHLKSD